MESEIRDLEDKLLRITDTIGLKKKLCENFNSNGKEFTQGTPKATIGTPEKGS